MLIDLLFIIQTRFGWKLFSLYFYVTLSHHSILSSLSISTHCFSIDRLNYGGSGNLLRPDFPEETKVSGKEVALTAPTWLFVVFRVFLDSKILSISSG